MGDATTSAALAEVEPSALGRARIGEVIGEKYEIVRLLGEGGMGVVYEVKHLAIGRRFAVKFLRLHFAQHRSVVARFRREAVTAATLQSDHIVGVYDFGTCVDGCPYLVMDCLDGEDIGKLLKRSGTLPVSRAIRLVTQVCRGLRVAHRRGVVHRDLKPENLFLHRDPDRGEILKILDFGIAKLTLAVAAETKTQSGLTLGTPFYMSPEQARGDAAVDERTDVYALGVILYELLTGEKPHPGAHATAILFHLLKQEPIRIEALRSGLPIGLGDAVHRAFAYEAADRFGSVEDLEAALAPFAGFAANDSASTLASAPVERASSSPSFRGARVVLALTVPACLAAVALVARSALPPRAAETSASSAGGATEPASRAHPVGGSAEPSPPSPSVSEDAMGKGSNAEEPLVPANAVDRATARGSAKPRAVPQGRVGPTSASRATPSAAASNSASALRPARESLYEP